MTTATDGPPRYIGRHRADDPITTSSLCENPARHYHLERSAAQELRFPPSVDASVLCPWCGKPYNPRGR